MNHLAPTFLPVFFRRWMVLMVLLIFALTVIAVDNKSDDNIKVGNNNSEIFNGDDNIDIENVKINSSKSCKLPNQDDLGECVAIGCCKAYLLLKNSSDITPQNINFMKRIQCRFEDKSSIYNIHYEPEVCCPVESFAYFNPEIHFTRSVRARILVGGKENRSSQKVMPKKFKRLTQKTYNSSELVVDDECGKQITNRIYGGEIAELDEYPWLALIFYNSNEFGCSGALINNRYVLTAAHCVTGSSVRRKNGLKLVRLGEFNVKTQPDCIEEENYLNCADAALDVGIDEIFVHPGYDEHSLNKFDDIALIRLKSSIPYTLFIMPICLPNKDDNAESPFESGKYFSVSGWGRTDLFNNYFPNIRSPIKLKLRVPYVSHENCSDLLKQHGADLGTKQICAGGELSKDTCAGDSGGPLMYFDQKYLRWVTYGIVSYGFTQCGLAGHPAVYTNVVEYVDWIKSVINTKK